MQWQVPSRWQQARSDIPEDADWRRKYNNYYYSLKKTMPTSVALTPHFESLTQQLVASGRYNNVSEVVREGLRLLESRVQEEAAKLAALRDAAKLGFDAIERGEHLVLKSDQNIRSLVKAAGVQAKALVLASSVPKRRSA